MSVFEEPCFNLLFGVFLKNVIEISFEKNHRIINWAIALLGGEREVTKSFQQ